MPRLKDRRAPKAASLAWGPFTGVNDALEPSAARPDRALSIRNGYIPLGGGSVLGRPGFTQAGAQLGGVGARTVQYLGQLTTLGATEYTIAAVAGELHTYNWGTNTWTKVVTTANLTTASAALSATARIRAVPFADEIILSDGTNQAISWDGTSGAGGITEIANGPTTAFGQPVVYYGKLFFIKGNERDVMVWSEEYDVATGYEAGGYTNAWTIGGARNERLFALAARNDALYVFREGSITMVTGAVGADFQTSGTRSTVSETLGTRSPDGVCVLEEGMVFPDQFGRPYFLPPGGQPIPIYAECTETLASVNRQSLGAVEAFYDAPTNVIVLGYPSPGNTGQADLWLTFTRTGGVPVFAGVWDGFPSQRMGQAKDGNGDTVFLHGGVSDGYVYAHGTPDGTAWDDSLNAAPAAIAHEVIGAPVNASINVDAYLDTLTAHTLSATDMSEVLIGVNTPRGAFTPAAVSIAGGGMVWDVDDWDEADWAGATVDMRKTVGVDGHGRWFSPFVRHASAGEQFGLIEIGAIVFRLGREPEIP